MNNEKKETEKQQEKIQKEKIQQEILAKLKGFSIREAKDLLYEVRRNFENSTYKSVYKPA